MKIVNRKRTTTLLIILAFICGVVIGMLLMNNKPLPANSTNVPHSDSQTQATPAPAVTAKPMYYKLTASEYELLCRVVAAEAGIEPLQVQTAVAQVILDRAKQWNKPVTEVVKQPKQFAAPVKGDISQYPDSIKAVQLVFTEGKRVYNEPTIYFFEPALSDIREVVRLRQYPYIGRLGDYEFRGGEKIAW